MKKSNLFFLSFILLASMMTPVKETFADNVDAKTARQVGAYFLSSQFGEKSITSSTLDLVYEIPNVSLGIPAVYVFNTTDQRGFVVVAGNDCVDPIIAYSTEGSFDPNNIPPNMMWWFNGQSQYVAYAQNNNVEPSVESLKEWKTLESEALPYFGSTKATVQLMSSKWNQEPLYNAMCPIINGGRSVTGCVATAMAQILYYWKYPYVGQYSTYYFHSITGDIIQADFGNSYYNYDVMVDKLTNSSTQEQINAVALLNFHCGVSVKMDYSPESSGAVSANVPRALYHFFKYEEDSLKLINRSDARYYHPNNGTTANVRDTNWYNDILAQLKMKRPVYYAGADLTSAGEDARHAFVCDGYNTTNKFMHFNWGWGGTGTAWCNVYNSKLNTNGYNFTSEHAAIIGITPPLDSIPESMRPVSINTAADPFTSNIFPNPASDFVTLYYNLNSENSETLQIFDATGRVVKQVTLYPGTIETRIQVSDLNPGIYICRLQGFSRKFIVK